MGKRWHRAVLAMAALLAACGCSQVLDWQPDHLLCAGTACDTGFSCLPEAAAAGSPHGCVRDETLHLGAACAQDQQCMGGNLCAGGACRSPCAALYQSGMCAVAQVCDQLPNATAPACVPSDNCVPGGTCWDTHIGLGVCVAFSDSERRCLATCNAEQAAEGEAPCGLGMACQAMGLKGQQELVCVPEAARTAQ